MSNNFAATKYKLQSVNSGKTFDDKGWMLDAPDETEPTLIRAIYEKSKIEAPDKGKEITKKEYQETVAGKMQEMRDNRGRQMSRRN